MLFRGAFVYWVDREQRGRTPETARNGQGGKRRIGMFPAVTGDGPSCEFPRSSWQEERAMVLKVTRKDVAQYRTQAEKDGRDVSHLTDAQILQQLRILRGGWHVPPPSEIDEILARAKYTEKLFQECRMGMLSDLEKALADFQAMDQKAASGSQSRESALTKRAGRVIALKRRLLAHPPSMLSPDFQKALELVDSWSVQAARVLEEKSPQGARGLLGLAAQLASLIEGLKKAAP